MFLGARKRVLGSKEEVGREVFLGARKSVLEDKVDELGIPNSNENLFSGKKFPNT